MASDLAHQADKRDAIASAILEVGKVREVYLDEEIATDGPFTMLLNLYTHREKYKGVAINVVLSAVDTRISTATYLLDRLVSWGYVNRVREDGEDRYMLSIATERTIESYLNDCVGKAEASIQRFERSR